VPSRLGESGVARTTLKPSIPNNGLLEVNVPPYVDPSDILTVAVESTVPVGVLSATVTPDGFKVIDVGVDVVPWPPTAA
jgi:hypothetical protein